MQIGKVKKLNKSVPHELAANQKNCHFEVSSSLTLCSNNEPFLDGIVMCDEKWILYDNQRQPARWLDWEAAPKHFPKPNLRQKKVKVIIWWSASGLIHYSFLNPGGTIISEKYAQQVSEMHRKLQRLQLALVNRMGPVLTMTTPDLTSHNQRFKSWTSGSWSFASSVIVTWPFANLLSLLQVSRQLFAGKMLP